MQDILLSLPTCLKITVTNNNCKEELIKSVQNQYPNHQFSEKQITNIVTNYKS